MPNKMKVLLAVFALSTLLNGLAGQWFFAAYGALMLVGLSRGHEGARTLLSMSSAAGAFLYAGLGIFALLGLSQGARAIVPVLISLSITGTGAIVCGLTVWCLNQPDVQHWMYERSMSHVPD